MAEICRDGSPPAPKASIPAHDPRFSALDANEDGYDTCKEFTHNDYDICKAYKASKLLAESIFYSPTVAVFKRPDPIPETIADAALGAAASLSLVIPVVGPAIFVGGSFASFACRVDLLNKAGSNAPDKFTLMKTDILAKLKEAQLVKFKSKLDTLLDVIQTRVDARDDIFNRVTSADYLVVLETFNILVSNAFNVTNAESYLLVMPKVLENQYCWADIDIEQAIVVLVPFLVQCMELRLVLAANLHDICKASADHQADADRYVTDFQVNLDFVRDTLAKVVKRMKEMTVTQRKQRRPHFDGKVKVPAKYSWFPADIYLDEIYDNMNTYVHDIAAWYGQQLQGHCDRHLTVLEQVVDCWDTVATALDTYWNTKSGSPGHPLDGCLKYQQMSALAMKADQEASKDKPVS